MFVKVVLIVESAPKMGDILFDPLIFESSGSYPSDEIIVPNLRTQDTSGERKSQYEGYIFDETKCKQVNGRILCGYDKNFGRIEEDVHVEMGNGCQMRGDRIECGYGNRQLIKHLRHPGNDHRHYDQNNADKPLVSMARQAPTRTLMKTTPSNNLKMKAVMLQNNLLKSALNKIVNKPGDKKNIVNKPPTPYTATNFLTTEKTTATTAKKIATSPKVNVDTTKSTSKIVTHPTSTLQEFEATSTSDGDSSDFLSSESDTHANIVILNKNNEEEKQLKKNRRLVESISTASKLVNKQKPNFRPTDPSIVSKSTCTNRVNELKTTTACVEKDDRVVCYDFMT